MSRYRKIEVRTWSDEKFRNLSPMQPSAQGLWFFLLTGPHTGPVPGLFRAGRASLAEELDWELEAFDEAFREVLAQGMAKADFKARLIWLPNALKHNRPESPNVVKSWRGELDLLPECDLKREALVAIRAYLAELGEAYVAALSADAKGSGDPSAKGSPKPSGKPSRKAMANQEQEQEQEQEEEKASLRSASSPSELADASGQLPGIAPADPNPAPKPPNLAERVAQIADEATAAYNASELVKSNGGLLANIRPSVGREKRQAWVKRCLRTARAICAATYGSERVTPRFWEDYWAACFADDFHAGRAGGGRGHERWLPDFEFLTREDVMLKVFERAEDAA